MIKAKQPLSGSINGEIIKQTLTGSLNNATIKQYPELEDLEVIPSGEEQRFKSSKYGFDNVTVNAVTIIEHYLEGTNLILVLPDNSTLTLDISSYIDGGLTEEQIEAINNMTFTIENENLVIEYDETVLDLNFSIDGENLMIENNVEEIDFNINENEELEVTY